MRATVGKEQGLIRIAIRLPIKLHRDIEAMAKMYGRSFNYEVKVRLLASIKLDQMLNAKTPTEAMELLEKLRRRLRGLRLPDEAD